MTAASKAEIRAAVLAVRRAYRPHERRRADAAIVEHLAAWLEHRTGPVPLPAPAAPVRIAGYAPLSTEPGGSQLLAFLAQAARGLRGAASLTGELWLPRSYPDGTLGWGQVITAGTSSPASQAVVTESLQPGAFGIAEPPGPYADSSILAQLDLVVLPAVAISRSNGMRLGKGAGYYDRALADLPQSAPVTIAVIYDDELLPAVPSDRHDRAVDMAVTPSGIHFFAGGNPWP